MITITLSHTPFKINKALTRRVVEHILKKENVWGYSLGIHVCDNKTIQKAHRDFMGDNTATDVMAFPQDAVIKGKKNHRKYLGDILVSAQMANERAKEFNTTPNEEYGLYVIHGLLHLLGYDDKEKNKKKVMEVKQNQYNIQFKLHNGGMNSK